MSSTDSLPSPVTGDDHVMGMHEAPVTLIEYGDFECPSCKMAASAVLLLMKRFTGRVRIVYRHFPLEEIHANALAAAEASEAAAAQGRFWEMHDLLFSNQSSLDSVRLIQLAEALRLQMGRFADDLNGHVHLARVRRDATGGRRLGIRATPTFYVNGTLCDVSFGFARLVRAVEHVLCREPDRSGVLRTRNPEAPI